MGENNVKKQHKHTALPRHTETAQKRNKIKSLLHIHRACWLPQCHA